MKLKDSEKGLLLGLLGIAVAVLTFMYVAKPNWEEMNAVKLESQQLQARLSELQQKQSNREQYIADTEKFNADFDEILNRFPADMNQEITIMFLEGIKDTNDFSIYTLAMGEKEEFYTLGNNGGETSLDATAPVDEAAADATTEAATTEAVTTDVALTEDEVVDSAYRAYKAQFPISYYGSYDGLKDVIAYVDTYTDRMTINSLSIEYNAEDDLYEGDIELCCYSIESTERPERSIELNEVEIGVNNIFDNGAMTTENSKIDDTLNKYDENDGAAIESSYDFYAMLNPASSDVSAKVVGQNGAGKEASVISNSDDSVSTLVFDIYTKDGKNYCKYTLDDGTSYEAEITSAEDIKILLQSSARKDDNDKVGIRVTINNSTSLPVYVKISGDDSTSPRVNIASKTGSVKVYK